MSHSIFILRPIQVAAPASSRVNPLPQGWH